jgi:putative membrane protein
MRTGLSSVAVGLGAARLLTDLEPQWLVRAGSLTLVVVGMMAVAFGFWSFRETLLELGEEGVRGIPIWIIGLFTGLLLAAAGSGLFLISVN